MEYVDYSRYIALYGDIEVSVFQRLLIKATRIIDYHTTGCDGYAKLKNAYPTEVGAVSAVQYCVCELINAMYHDETALMIIEQANSFSKREDGTYQPNKISSLSSGAESVSFSTSANSIDSGIIDRAKRESNYREIVTECLRGVLDANGVNLLYMGVYPICTKKQ